jgi:hypothetical protein
METVVKKADIMERCSSYLKKFFTIKLTTSK